MTTSDDTTTISGDSGGSDAGYDPALRLPVDQTNVTGHTPAPCN